MSLPTPIYKLNAAQQQSVYEPAEDTFLLLDAIEKDIQVNMKIFGRIYGREKRRKLRDISPEIVLEIGCGSGVVSTFVNQ
ncbi:hypothetical protein ANCDUO_09189, partial [Ancylostoma duodenale]